MNTDSEQITLDKNLVIAQDQPYTEKQLRDCLVEILGPEHCKTITVPPRKKVVEYQEEGKTIRFLVKACTYLGNPHPIFKKRVQLPLWFNEYVKDNPRIDIRYIGIYHYGDKYHGDNVIIIDFKKDTYLLKKGHNSSAHVYTNDLFQAMTYGVFSKEDLYGNTITAIRRDCLKDYLLNRQRQTVTLFDLFRQFNNGFTFGQWIQAMDAIKEMHQNGWKTWHETEWAGFFLEYMFNNFTIDKQITNQMRYVGNSRKGYNGMNYDIFFGEDDFYGDLKSSDIEKKIAPGNDKKMLVECIYQYDKFWYVVYEHETKKEGDKYDVSKARLDYIEKEDPTYKKRKSKSKNHRKLKSEVKFVKMSILELNRVNFREALSDFHQGRQPDGKPRALKFNINKRVLENDNFVVFRYTYNG